MAPGDRTSNYKVNPLKYARSAQPFSKAQFSNPASEYRGAPFWSWNGKLRAEKLIEQIHAFKEMGMGGFHMHPRVGLDTVYLSDGFLDCVDLCAREADKLGMLTCLYDDDRWPSGCAGGLVTKLSDDYKTKHLLVTPFPYGQGKIPPHRIGYGPKGKGARSENGHLVARYEIKVASSGQTTYRRLVEDEESSSADGVIWYTYLETNPPADWYNESTYVDCMNKEATNAFLKMTHERYFNRFADRFGDTIPSIFTDEPQIEHKSVLVTPEQQTDLLLPWGSGFQQTFINTYGYDFLDRLPEFLWDVPSATMLQTRYHFQDLTTECFISGFHDTVGDWCKSKNILLTGHMMYEPTLSQQTIALGEAMRSYRKMGLPGIDLLCDRVEYTTAKQAVSVGRQNGIKGATSEIYGVTNWTFTFDGHKGCGDWQTALGITFRVHHLSPYTLLGEAKRDYPAAISYQSPWYKQYNYVETYFARLNVALTRGQPVTRVAVVHPIESYWLSQGPQLPNLDEQTFRDTAFQDLSHWLLHGLVDFDFISESLFKDQTALDRINDRFLPVGACRYEAVIVANMRTIRKTTWERLQRFKERGGTVIFTGEIPSLVDAAPSQLVSSAIRPQDLLQFTQHHILEELKDFRDIDISIFNQPAGRVVRPFMYQLRADGDDQYLFVCNRDRRLHLDSVVGVRGQWRVTVLDATNGDEWKLDSETVAGWTRFAWTFEPTSSLLLRLTHDTELSAWGERSQVNYRSQYRVGAKVQLQSVSFSEPNVLLLDKAKFKVVGQGADEWSEETEVLRIDNLARARMGKPPKGEGIKQPWAFTEAEREPIGTLQLQFTISCTDAIPGELSLALENAEQATVKLDGRTIERQLTGHFVDHDIKAIALVPEKSTLCQGQHTLEISYPFAISSSVERAYVLGDTFSVEIRGEQTTLVRSRSHELTFGDWTARGLPFYAGNVTYHCIVDCPEDASDAAIHLPELVGCPVATVELVDPDVGRDEIIVGFQPLTESIGPIKAGRHRIDITCFGNRENAFGAIHVPSGKTDWFGPDAWRTEHDWWTDGYNVKPMGLLQTPQLLVPGQNVYSSARPTGH